MEKTQNGEGDPQVKEATVEMQVKYQLSQKLKQKQKRAQNAKAAASAAKAALKAEVKASKGESRQNKKDADLAAEAAEATGEAASSSTRKHGVGLIENKSMSFWKSQNITILKQQAELRGHRFTDLETKGGGPKSKF